MSESPSVSYEHLCEGIRRRLVIHRQARKLNINQASKLAGFSRTGLEKIENGDVQPSLESVLKLAEFYGESLPLFLKAVEGSLGIARDERAKHFEKETKRQVHQTLLLEMAAKLGLSEWLDELSLLAALAIRDPETADAVRRLIHVLPKS
jgi:transcriptional regulator with XRE-family HTH domain